jgi:hypothetical protein
MKTPTLLMASALVLTLGVAAPLSATAADKPAKDECFWTRNITSFAAPDDHTVYVKVGMRDVYRLDLMISCPDVDWNQRVGLQSSHGAGGSICGPLDAEIVSHAAGIGAQRCPVKAMHKLTPDEIAALPTKAKP